MKRNLITLLAILLMIVATSIAQTKSILINQGNNAINCSYNLVDGRINGNYVSYYSNGTKRAEGMFENSYRTGKWTVWDSTGKMLVQRVFENPFVYKSLYPEHTFVNSAGKVINPKYSIKYNNDGFIERFDLKEKMVLWSKRIWRTLGKENNETLFENDRLYKFIYENISTGIFKAYTPDNDEYKIEMLPSEIQKMSSERFQIVEYKLKEDYFFDSVRLVMDAFIIGLCPVAFDKTLGKTVDMFWVYYPSMRKQLAKESVGNKSFSNKIKTLDDLFYNRGFGSTIYKESNVYNKSIAEYGWVTDLVKESDKIELGMIETEHDLWIEQ